MAEFVRDIEDVVNIREHFGINNLQKRNFRPRKNPFEKYNDKEFRKRYRLTKQAVEFIVNLVEDELQPMSLQNFNITVSLQILTTLRYFAKGCYQIELGDLHGLSQATVSRIIRKVSRAIASKLPIYVKFPTDINNTKQQFFNVAHLPGLVGCIDCTHVRIKNPDGTQPLLYCNRKGFYSLNVQVVCDANTRILDIVARWRGSTHDARIWSNCALKDKFEDSTIKGILLGDSGYPSSNYMLTPLLHPANAAEEAYNSAHKTTRVIVECCFGRWKGMFKALKNGMQVSLPTARACIAAMAVLYNIKLDFDNNFDNEDDSSSDDSDNDSDSSIEESNDSVEHRNCVIGNVFRKNYISKYFIRRN